MQQSTNPPFRPEFFLIREAHLLLLLLLSHLLACSCYFFSSSSSSGGARGVGIVRALDTHDTHSSQPPLRVLLSSSFFDLGLNPEVTQPTHNTARHSTLTATAIQRTLDTPLAADVARGLDAEAPWGAPQLFHLAASLDWLSSRRNEKMVACAYGRGKRWTQFLHTHTARRLA